MLILLTFWHWTELYRFFGSDRNLSIFWPGPNFIDFLARTEFYGCFGPERILSMFCLAFHFSVFIFIFLNLFICLFLFVLYFGILFFPIIFCARIYARPLALGCFGPRGELSFVYTWFYIVFLEYSLVIYSIFWMVHGVIKYVKSKRS